MRRSPVAALVLFVLALPSLPYAAPVVRGRVLGSDGKPLARAIVRPLLTRHPHTVKAGPDGRYELVLDGPGAHLVWFLGTYHRDMNVPVVVDSADTVELDVRLASQRYRAKIDSVGVIGEFNDYDRGSALAMTRQKDGTFTLRIDPSNDTLRYQLVGVDENGDPSAGTEADTFYNRMTWVSGVRVREHPMTLTFDPRRLRRGPTEPVVQFRGGPPDRHAIYEIFHEDEFQTDRIAREKAKFQARGGNPDTFDYDFGPERREYARRIERESRPTVRHMLMMEWLRMWPEARDSALVRRAVREIPPDSPLWTLIAPLGNAFLRALWVPVQGPAFVAEVADRNPSLETRGEAQLALVNAAWQAGDTVRARTLYARFKGDLSGSSSAVRATRMYDPDRAIQIGRPLPEYAFQALEGARHADA